MRLKVKGDATAAAWDAPSTQGRHPVSALRPRPLISILTLALSFALTAVAKSPPGMVLIPAGVYRPVLTAAGDPANEPVAAFYLDQRPVSNADYLAFVRANPQWRRSHVARLFAEPEYLADWAGDLEPGSRAPMDAPVVEVSWFAARVYAQWAGKRLPTTAEWERAAAAGFHGPDGRHEPGFEAAVLAWFTQPAPAVLPAAGSGRPNFLGVRDLLDLVWEWVDDFNAGNVIGGNNSAGVFSCAGAATGARDPSDYPAFMRLAFRTSLHGDYTVANLGFRCARDVVSSIAQNP